MLFFRHDARHAAPRHTPCYATFSALRCRYALPHYDVATPPALAAMPLADAAAADTRHTITIIATLIFAALVSPPTMPRLLLTLMPTLLML